MNQCIPQTFSFLHLCERDAFTSLVLDSHLSLCFLSQPLPFLTSETFQSQELHWWGEEPSPNPSPSEGRFDRVSEQNPIPANQQSPGHSSLQLGGNIYSCGWCSGHEALCLRSLSCGIFNFTRYFIFPAASYSIKEIDNNCSKSSRS